MLDILFCGLPRNFSLLRTSLNDIDVLKSDNIVENIAFSTWKNKLSSEYRELLNKNNVHIIESDEPQDFGERNIWLQMKSLEYGLEHCDNSNYVLKTRSDVWLSPNLIRMIVQDNYLDKENTKIFRKKIWIPWAEIRKPFYMEDACFCGLHCDICKMVNYDSYYDILCKSIGGGETHIRRFIHPFIHKPMVKKKINDFINMDRVLSNDEYIEFLAIYYDILYKYFRIKTNHGSFKMKQPYHEPKISLNSNEFRANFNSSKMFFMDRTFCYDDVWIHNMFNGTMCNDDYLLKIKTFLEKYND